MFNYFLNTFRCRVRMREMKMQKYWRKWVRKFRKIKIGKMLLGIVMGFMGPFLVAFGAFAVWNVAEKKVSDVQKGNQVAEAAPFSPSPFFSSAPKPTPTPTSTPQPSIKPTPKPTPKITPKHTPESPLDANVQYINAYITYYGYPDNDPAGRDIAYPDRKYLDAYHNEADGVGTYDDPITLAVAKGVYKIGTKIYVPYIKKYVVVEDICATCRKGGQPHLDIWMESNESHEQALYQCQRKWTRKNVEVEINPPLGRLVDTTPLFNTDAGTCY